MSSVNINGVTYTGNNITINGGRVIIDGKDHTPDSKVINISVEGNIETLSVDSCNKMMVVGQVGSACSVSGDIQIEGSVSGNVKTISGDVDCGAVGGAVSTLSGDIRHIFIGGKAGMGGSGG